ncbi:hypothetical protein [Altericroceibacterium endophyticum]|uniref:Uncharacterized protein n=1 Tax=Altericroceibacterium endophyticum TaxID=1808508 RepID=A0A6I4T0M6_9SPHN|nr:hypothetical protein [Altericroceibacterium endophyticum]MXO64664.1 hypothetical protein [Altericroceibacterium endophyticum]
MDQTRITTALARIEAATSRIDRATQDIPELRLIERKYGKLQTEMQGILAEVDQLIGKAEA